MHVVSIRADLNSLAGSLNVALEQGGELDPPPTRLPKDFGSQRAKLLCFSSMKILTSHLSFYMDHGTSGG